MLDFMPGEKLYAAGIDPADPRRAVGCVYLDNTPPGHARVQFLNRQVAAVPLRRICKTPEDALKIARDE